MPSNREARLKLRQEVKGIKKRIKKEKKARDLKFQEWESLPVEKWSEARKKKNNINLGDGNGQNKTNEIN